MHLAGTQAYPRRRVPRTRLDILFVRCPARLSRAHLPSITFSCAERAGFRWTDSHQLLDETAVAGAQVIHADGFQAALELVPRPR
jgi:hypothetical protein